MITTYYREKLINAIIYFAENTRYCGKTKLLKLLYFLDFRHFKQTGKPVTGLEYFAWDMGPVPRDLFNELSGNMKSDLRSAIRGDLSGEKFQKIVPKKTVENEYFSKREMKLLKDISFIFRDSKADEMVESTHLPNEPWEKTIRERGKYNKIDYMLAVDNMDDSLSLDEARDRKEEISEMHTIFGVI